MKTLIAMIRKQKITVDVKKQALHVLQQRHADSEQELQLWRNRCRETEQYLWLQVATGHEIALDHLHRARQQLAEQQDSCVSVERQLEQLNTDIEQLVKDIAYAEKALEKFADLVAERKREARSEAQRAEWQALDEWALNIARQRA